MYFQNFPKIFYDFNKNDEDTSLQILTDITANVRLRKQILENITLYDEYDIQDGETPEIIAEKFYGNPELHWTIMLVNQRYNYLEDFPMSMHELDQHVKTRYGENKYNAIHHYEKNGIITEAQATLKVPLSTVSPVNLFKVHDFLLWTFGSARIESIDVAGRMLSILIDNGTFTSGAQVNVRGFRLNEDSTNRTLVNAFNFTVPPNAFELSPLFTIVTNYEYEYEINESKRRIKLISPSLINKIVGELKELIQA